MFSNLLLSVIILSYPQGSAESLSSVKNQVNESALKPVLEELRRLRESVHLAKGLVSECF